MYSNGVRVVPSEVVYSCSAVHVLLYESTKIKVHNYEGTISTCTFVHVYFRTLYLRSTKVRRYLRSTKVRKYESTVQLLCTFESTKVRRYESTFESTFVREITSSTRTYNVHVRCTCTRTVHYTCRTRAGLSFRPTDTTNIRKEEGGCVHEASKQELMNNTAPSSGLFSFSATRRRDARACACICIDGMVGGSPPA